jgi:hypothetical protein
MSNNSKSFLNDRVLTRGAKEGYCRICKQFGELTRDHIPPKGSIIISPVELRTLGQHADIKPVVSQDGTNFRTICSYCNNTLLGTEYDPQLNKVSNKAGSLVKQVCDLSYCGISLPSQVTIEVKPQRLARAIIGHLLASNYHPAQSDINDSFLFPEASRKYFLNPNETLPKEINIYYWFYPDNRQVLVHGASMVFWAKPDQPILFSLVKFFPIAYWIIWEKPEIFPIKCPFLFKNRNIGIDETEEIKINLSQYPRLDFPEHPYDGEEYVIGFNPQRTSVATKKKKGFGKSKKCLSSQDFVS